MKKTFLVGFLGLFLVGGFVTGLYLVNQRTNPPSSAKEIINPVAPPTGSGNGQDTTGFVAPSAAASSAGTLAGCQKAFGMKSADAGYIKACDLDNNGIINVLDLSKLK